MWCSVVSASLRGVPTEAVLQRWLVCRDGLGRLRVPLSARILRHHVPDRYGEHPTVQCSPANHMLRSALLAYPYVELELKESFLKSLVGLTQNTTDVIYFYQHLPRCKICKLTNRVYC